MENYFNNNIRNVNIKSQSMSPVNRRNNSAQIDLDYINKLYEKKNFLLQNKLFTLIIKFHSIFKKLITDINSVLIERTNRPCSFHVCFINKLPVKNIYFNYTFVELDYMPFFFSYANDSLSCILYLFIVDN